jgi:ATP-binding cassette, subfamily G (WHITE), member 2
MWVTLPAFGAVAYAPSIVLERRLFYREHSDGLYRVGTYLVAKLVGELVLAAVIAVIFSAGTFYGVGYQGSFLVYWCVWTLWCGCVCCLRPHP